MLTDGMHGLWRVQTDKTIWIIDLDARTARHEVLGMDDVHTPGRTWVLMRLRTCTIGEPLEWVLSGSPGGIPWPQPGEAEVVIDIAPQVPADHRSMRPDAAEGGTS